MSRRAEPQTHPTTNDGSPDAPIGAGRARTGVRDRLLSAADRLFYREGVRAVGIDRVLAEAGAAKASLYDHFASKDELVAAYIASRSAEAQATLGAHAASAGLSPAGKVLALFDAAIAMAEEENFRGCPFTLLAAEFPDPAHPTARACVAQRAWVSDLVERLVRESAPTAPEDLACAITTLYEGAVGQAAMQRSAAPVRSAKWAAATLLEHAAGADDAAGAHSAG
jgi:AcrR family transcriptional regulator